MPSYWRWSKRSMPSKNRHPPDPRKVCASKKSTSQDWVTSLNAILAFSVKPFTHWLRGNAGYGWLLKPKLPHFRPKRELTALAALGVPNKLTACLDLSSSRHILFIRTPQDTGRQPPKPACHLPSSLFYLPSPTLCASCTLSLLSLFRAFCTLSVLSLGQPPPSCVWW